MTRAILFFVLVFGMLDVDAPARAESPSVQPSASPKARLRYPTLERMLRQFAKAGEIQNARLEGRKLASRGPM